jgi:NAD(P)-dependent dehydrogenase (short-subunit alcohol dehydrogenase family)
MESTSLALVTGAGHRLGKHLALSLAQLGYAVLVHYKTSRKLAEQTAAEIKARGGEAFLVQADLTNEAEVEQLFVTIDGLPGKLKVLVNSAAVMLHKDLDLTTTEDWDAVFNLNLRAPFLLSQRAARRMTPDGVIINISDSGARKLWIGYPAYVTSKAALETLTRLMAKAFAPGIRVNAIAPGLVQPMEGMPSEEWARLVERLPMKRSTSPDEIASALAFLLENRSITGQVISVDGGYSLV